MKWSDCRGRKVALVCDGVLNPAPGTSDLLGLFVARGWGVIGLPPERLGASGIAAWLAGAADQARELHRHGLAVVAVLDPGELTVSAELDRALAAPPALRLPVLVVSGIRRHREIAAFLDRHGATAARAEGV